MKKISIAMLDELTKDYEKLSEIEMKGVIGGGNGTVYAPYTQTEMIYLINNSYWQGGYVEDIGYVDSCKCIIGPDGTRIGRVHTAECKPEELTSVEGDYYKHYKHFDATPLVKSQKAAADSLQATVDAYNCQGRVSYAVETYYRGYLEVNVYDSYGAYIVTQGIKTRK